LISKGKVKGQGNSGKGLSTSQERTIAVLIWVDQVYALSSPRGLSMTVGKLLRLNSEVSRLVEFFGYNEEFKRQYASWLMKLGECIVNECISEQLDLDMPLGESAQKVFEEFKHWLSSLPELQGVCDLGTDGGIEKEKISQYLLSQLPEDEHKRLEERVFKDDRILEDLEVLEDSMVRKYIHKELPPNELIRFERIYLATDRGRKKVWLAQALHAFAQSRPNIDPKEGERKPQ
jgi:hypothetical protein